MQIHKLQWLILQGSSVLTNFNTVKDPDKLVEDTRYFCSP